MAHVLALRVATPMDAAAIHAIYTPYVRDSPASFELEPPTEDELRARLCATLKQFPYFVCMDHGAVVGYAYGSLHRSRKAYDWSCEISVYVAPTHQRLGIGHAMCVALLEALRAQGYCLAISGVTQPNAASMALHHRVGFEVVGIYKAIGFKHGRWHDSAWLQCDLRCQPGQSRTPTEELPPPPGPPQPFPTLGADVVARCLAAGTPFLKA